MDIEQERKRCAKKIEKAFDGVDLTRHTFTVHGAGKLDAEGETRFYKAGEIDKAIQRLIDLIDELNND